MSAYKSRYAEYYDVIYADKAYASEVAFLAHVVAAHTPTTPKTWLDVACGTGSHVLELAARGYAVTGLDYSATQLACARDKVQAQPASKRAPIEFVEGDMCEFDLGSARFDVVSCLFDSLGYAVTNERVVAALKRMRAHLTTHGQVVLEFWHAAAMLRSYEPLRVRRFASADGELLRRSETSLDVATQTCSVKFTLSVPVSQDTHVDICETHVCRFFLLQEMSALLHSAGLCLKQAYAGFDATAPITTDTWHIVVVATAHSVP